MQWTPERLDLLRTLRNDPNLTNEDIGKRLGVSGAAVVSTARLKGLGKRPIVQQQTEAGRERMRAIQRALSRHSPEKIERVRQMWNNGLSYGGIGRAIGETVGVVAGIVTRHKFDRRHRAITDAAWTDDEDTVLRNGVAEGESHKEIAMRLPRRTAKAVRGRCALIGLSAEYREAQELRFRRRIKRHHEARQSDEGRANARSNIFMVNLAHKRIAVKAMAPLRSIVCESVRFTPEHRGCAWLTSDGRPWMVCAGKRAVGVYCADHFKLSIGAVDPEPDEPAEAIPMLEAA